MVTVGQAAKRVGRSTATVRRWLRRGRLGLRWGEQRDGVERGSRRAEDKPHPMAELPDEWKVGDDGEPTLNWVAAIHRSRASH
jgi:transposase